MNFRLIYRHIVKTLLAFAVLLLCAFIGLSVWVLTGTRSINAVNPYIEQAIAAGNSRYKIKIEQSNLEWEGWSHPVVFHVKKVRAINEKGAVVVYLPDVSVKLYIEKLLFGKIEVKSLIVKSPSILFSQEDSGNISVAEVESKENSKVSFDEILAMIIGNGNEDPIFRLKSLVIEHATLSLKKQDRIIFQSIDFNAEINRNKQGLSAKFNLPLIFEEKSGIVKAGFEIEPNSQNIASKISYAGIPLAVLRDLIPGQKILQGIDLPVSGETAINSDFTGNIKSVDFVCNFGKGSLNYPEQFKMPVKIDNIHIFGNISDNLNKLTIKEGNLTLANNKNIDIDFNAEVTKVGDDIALTGKAHAENIPATDLDFYWPLTLSPHSREWVTTRIDKGIITKGDVAVNFAPGELKTKFTPKRAVDATVIIKDADIRYIPRHPKVTGINGVVKFTGDSMDANIQKASYMNNTIVTSANAIFPDLNPDDVRLLLDINFKSDAKDAVAFMSLPELNKAKKLGLTDEAGGNIEGNAKLDFIAFSINEAVNEQANLDNMKYSLSGDLHKFSQNKFLGKHDVEDANFKFELDNKGIKAQGKTLINRLPFDVDLESKFATGNPTDYSLVFDLPVARMPDFGLPKLDFLSGTIGITGKFNSSDDSDITNAILDLSKTEIKMKDHGFFKKAGEKATLNIVSEKLESGDTAIKSMLLKGNNFSFIGKGEVDKKSGDLNFITFSKLRFNENNLDYLDYRKLDNGIELTAKGKVFDISPYFNKKDKKDDDISYQIEIETDKLIFGEKRVMQNAQISIDCDEICNSADIKANLTGGEAFNYSIANGDVKATCGNVGELLKVLGILQTIDGGTMQMLAKYNDKTIEGLLTVDNYTLRNAPLLTKIFTIASLTGILDTLSGNGVAFDKFYAPFSYRHGNIILSDARTHGPALGFTAKGTIDNNNDNLDLQGVIVPSYTINSLVGNVPLIGDLLIGGSGKGIVALDYTIKGNSSDPSISANPLSVLTPGFLRNIFNIFDKPAPDMDKIEAERRKQKALESKKQ